MSQKKNTPSKETPEKVNTTTEKPPHTPKKVAPKKVANLFMAVLLLLIAGGFYLYQKGYVDQYYPIVKSNVISKGPLEVPEQLKTIASATNPQESTVPNIATPKKDPTQQNSDQLAALETKLQALEAKLTALEGAQSTPAPIPTLDTTALKTFMNLQDLDYKIKHGLPFAPELTTLNDTFSPEDLMALKEFEAFGVPTLSYLITEVKKVTKILDQEEAFQSSSTILEKLTALLNQLIHIEKIEADTTAHPSKATHYKARLRNGDIANVIKDIEALNPTDETVTLWLSHAKAYESTTTILNKTKQALFTSTNYSPTAQKE